jgi:7,8-dihydropterin-6-yl-methyl-4-(beta-D-ribofuranosyl)aminobenzene 5'-phosphate synthase
MINMEAERRKKVKDIISAKSIVLFAVFLTCLNISSWPKQIEASTIRLSVVYNNVPFDSRLENNWGFSCLIEGVEQTILFDTGGPDSILLNNMKIMGISPEVVHSVFLSHYHTDHIGGLDDFLRQNSNVNIYLIESFPEWYRDMLKDSGAKVKMLNDPTKLSDQVYTTGEMIKMISEHSLIIRTSEGLVIITGCAHPGIVDIVKKSKELLNDNVRLVMGGFHLLRKSTNQIEAKIEELKNLGVKKVAPSHCTGDEAIDLFRKAWGNNFLESGTGKIIEVKK